MNALHRTAAALIVATVSMGAVASDPDPLAAEIARWTAFIQDHPDGGETWTDVKASSAPVLVKAQEALTAGRRVLALDRLAIGRTNLAAQAYVDRCAPALSKELPALEAEWTRVGKDLGPLLAKPSKSAAAGITPAIARAEAEAALLQIRGFYDSVLEYARATEPQYGLFYLGQAQAQRDFVAFCRTLRPATEVRPISPRSIAADIEALNRELLAAYRPPASIDRHSEFIVAHSLVNEARQLDAAGLAHGALLRYLQAAMRSASLRGVTPVGPDVLAVKTEEFEAILKQPGTDDSVGRLFLEAALSNAELGPFIAADVFPRYIGAVGKATVAAKVPPPQVTITLVRWPYT
jgi:hypothetical protein